MDQKYLDALLAGTATPDMVPADAPASTEAPPVDNGLLGGLGDLLTAKPPEDLNATLQEGVRGALEQTSGPQKAIASAVMGGLKGVFETGDFLFGDTPKERQSAARQTVESLDAEAKEESPIVGGLSSGIGQFAGAMIGLGKLGAVGRMIPAVGKGAAAVEGLKGAKTVLETGKAALAGAVAFDPYEERLSNMLQDTFLANPVSEWLSAKPTDTAAWGRVKSAMESIGMDAAIIASLKVGGSIYKHMQAGNVKAARRVASDFEAQRAADMEAVPEINTEIDGRDGADGFTSDFEAGLTDADLAAAKLEGNTLDLTANPQGAIEDGSKPRSSTGQPTDSLGGEPPATGGLPEAGAPGGVSGPDASPSGPLDAGAEGSIGPQGVANDNAADGGIPPGAVRDGDAIGLSGSADEASSKPLVNGEPTDMEYVKVDPTANPTQAMMDKDLIKPPKYKNTVDFEGGDFAGQQPVTGMGPRTRGMADDMQLVFEEAEKDWSKLTSGDHEDVLSAAGRGVKFSPDMRTFYDRMKTDSDVINAIDLAVHMKEEQLAAQGFRGTLTDQKLMRQVRAFAQLANIDPSGLMGILAQGAKATRQLTAKMIVIGSLTTKAFTDATLLATRYRMQDYSEFGTKEAMEDAIAKRFSMATTMLRMTDEYRSQAGRSLRALRGKPFNPDLFKGLPKDRFYDLLIASKGNPKKLRILADPSLYDKIMDTANYIRINSLVSGWTTQTINILSNGYMLGARPLERILAGTLKEAYKMDGSGHQMVRENLKQYAYMGAAFMDGWKTAVMALTRNDSILRPHGSEVMNVGDSGAWQVPGSQAMGPGFFKPWDSTPNLIYNALSIPLGVVGVPTRLLGGTDELMKQITYRSKVMASAYMRASEQAMEQGLTGKGAKNFINSYVDDAVDNAFDMDGRGVDPEALREANIATHQQDLLPGSLGKGIQTLVSNDKTKMLRFILPFVKTPTNVIRYGWKMTPGLNMLQSEYRAMLSGKMDPEAQAQAVGQMTMGALFMGAAGFVIQDRMTGGGPTDPKAKAELMATGWRPYSIVDENEDGTKTFVPYNRFDPVALPLGIMADIMDAIEAVGDDEAGQAEVEAAIGALGISLAKQFTSRTYLLSLNQALEALADPGKRGANFAGSMAASFVPFSSLTRQASSDPYMRDARTVTDKMLAVVPGLSPTIRPRYNWLGQPIVNRTGLWTDDNGTLVDKEVQRLALLPDASMISAPSPNWGKVDLRDITLADGSNAYEKYQQLSAQPKPGMVDLRTSVARLMRSEAYQKSADGDAGLKGTKLYMLHEMVYRYRDTASRIIKSDKTVQDALLKDVRAVQDHWKNLKTPLAPEQQGTLDNILRGFGAGAQQGQ